MLKLYLSTDARPVFSLVLSWGAMVPFANQTEDYYYYFYVYIFGARPTGAHFLLYGVTAVQSV